MLHFIMLFLVRICILFSYGIFSFLLYVLIYFRIYLSYNIWKHYFCMTVFSIFSFIFGDFSKLWYMFGGFNPNYYIIFFLMVKMDMLRWYKNMGCLPTQFFFSLSGGNILYKLLHGCLNCILCGWWMYGFLELIFHFI